MNKWQLKRTTQCKNCPWLVDSDKSKIPGYNPEAHNQLVDTIQEQSVEQFMESLSVDKPLAIMACHESPDNEQYHCIGWINNQLIHNNLQLRWHMLFCENANDINNNYYRSTALVCSKAIRGIRRRNTLK